MAEKGERRSPTGHRTPTQMVRKARSKTQNSSPKAIKSRTASNAARATINAERKKAGKPKLKTTQHVDHKKPQIKGGTNARSNLRVQDAKKNVSHGMANQHTKRKAKAKAKKR